MTKNQDSLLNLKKLEVNQDKKNTFAKLYKTKAFMHVSFFIFLKFSFIGIKFFG